MEPTKSWGKDKVKKDKLRSISEQSGESVELDLNKSPNSTRLHDAFIGHAHRRNDNSSY